MHDITVVGAGVTGLWQALRLSQAGHHVRLVERSRAPFESAASRLAGAMLAPFCETESAEPIIREMGLKAVPLWREICPHMKMNGSLVVAQPRDLPELQRFGRLTEGFERVGPHRIASLEPALAERYSTALFYPQEAHVEPALALQTVLQAARDAGCETVFGADGLSAETGGAAGRWIIDCRGLAATDELSELRGVRGEMLIIETGEITLDRPVRLLHPRIPFYVVPWSGQRFMIGATVLESASRHEVSVRSALELLGAAFSLHPAFGEARIISFAADARPAFPDNLPRIIVRGRHIYVNGLYRHGYLLAPVLADLTAAFLAGDSFDKRLFHFN